MSAECTGNYLKKFTTFLCFALIVANCRWTVNDQHDEATRSQANSKCCPIDGNEDSKGRRISAISSVGADGQVIGPNEEMRDKGGRSLRAPPMTAPKSSDRRGLALTNRRALPIFQPIFLDFARDAFVA